MREIRIDDSAVSRGKKDSKHVRDVEVPSSDMGFRVSEIQDDYVESQQQDSMREVLVEEREPGDQVKVKFDKFVQLVATHNFEEVLKTHADEDIVMNSNLLMDLASAHEDQVEDPKRQPMLIGIGVVIGVVAAYILLKFL